MELFHDRNQRNINDALAIIKLASLLLCAIELFNIFKDKVEPSIYEVQEDYLIAIVAVTVTIILGIYLLWSFFTIWIYRLKHVKFALCIETAIFILVYSILIITTGGNASNLKFLFLFSIITTTIQIGKYYGVIVASISSIIVSMIDLAYRHKGVNEYLQNDLTIIGIFMLIAWVLGYYVKVEREIISQKNLQLETMDKEIKENSKQREYMEEIILKNNSCYDLLIENSSNAIFVHRNGEIIFANESAVRLVEAKDVANLVGTSFFEFITEKDKDNVNRRLGEALNDKSISTFEHELESDFGASIGVRNISTYFSYEGKPTVLTILHDITPEKQVIKLQDDMRKNISLLNETRELNKVITEFFSNISHELKTPLNVIFSAIQLLNSYKADSMHDYQAKQENYLKVMKQNCYRLTRLINNILDMTRVDSGFLKLNLGNYNVVSVVEDIVLSVVYYAESKGIILTFDTNTEEKIMALDPDKIERIILNLLSNAIKFTNFGGEIFVNLIDNGDKISVSIRDTGVGIPEDKLEVIFERFAQVNKTLKRNHEGSGIGLSLVKSFVEMHKGNINISSKLGYGSEFIIELPVEILEQESMDDSYIFESNIERINIEFSDIYS